MENEVPIFRRLASQGVYYVPNKVGDQKSFVELDEWEMEIELKNVSETDPITITIENWVDITHVKYK